METYKGWTIKPMIGYCLATKRETTSIQLETMEEVKAEIDKKEPDFISCPFCGEKDFDKIGLKQHLINGYCEEYLNTQSIARKF